MRTLVSWLRSFLLHRRLEREMQEEMSQHVERATERLIARGLTPEEARKAALREFGNVSYLQEKAREARGGRWLEALTPDAKLALRMLVKNPALSVVGGLGMAVAIAIATGFFTFMTFYYSDPPLEDGDRIVTVEYINGDFGQHLGLSSARNIGGQNLDTRFQGRCQARCALVAIALAVGR